MKILLAVDGSPYTKKMLAYLSTHNDLFATANQYSLIHVQPAVPARVHNILGKEVVKKYYAEEAQKVLVPVTKFLQRHGIQASSSWKVGHAAEQIVKACEAEAADLLVMGSHGHGSLANMVMGSVATKVLASSQVPVLLVR